MLGVVIDQGFKKTVTGAALSHGDLVVTDQDVGVDDVPAFGAGVQGSAPTRKLHQLFKRHLRVIGAITIAEASGGI